MTLYIGVDIHARQQTVSYLNTDDGSTGQVELSHEGDEIKGFYSQFQGEVIIGIEACGYTNWFEDTMPSFSQDFKNPPTAVGGILTFVQSPFEVPTSAF